MEEYLVSIIVPAYNAARYVANCMDGILAQSYRNFEAVMVDDGSTDGTREIIREYAEKDPRIKGIFPEHGGVSAARNEGLKHAAGRFITFIDADDVVSDRYVEGLLSPCTKDQADISICSIHRAKEGEIFAPAVTGDYQVRDIDHTILDTNIICRGAGVMFRRAVIQGVFFDTDLYVGEDMLFFCKALDKGTKIAITEDPLYCYYQYRESAYRGKYDDRKFTDLVAWQRVMEIFGGRPALFRNTLSRQYAWLLLNNLLHMEADHYSNRENRRFCLRETRRMRKYISNRIPGGGKRGITLRTIYKVSCISPWMGNIMFRFLLGVKQRVGRK